MVNKSENSNKSRKHRNRITSRVCLSWTASSFEDKTNKVINRRITNAWRKYWFLRCIFKGKIQMNIKRKVFGMCVSPTVTYGCQ